MRRPVTIVALALLAAHGSSQGLVQRISGPLLPASDVGLFAWSPDFRRIVFTADADTDDAYELFALDVNDLVRVKLNTPLDFLQDVYSFAFSPSSPEIAFVVTNSPMFFPGTFVDELHGAPLDGSATPTLLDAGVTENRVGPIQITADRQVFFVAAFDAFHGDYRSNLYRSALDGSSGPSAFTANPSFFSVVAFACSEAAGRVVYSVDHPPVSGSDPRLWSAPLAGGASIPLDAPAHAYSSVQALELQPSGARVVYTADSSVPSQWELWSAPVDGSSPPLRLSPALAPDRDVDSSRFRLSPDGAHVVFRADRDVDEVFELYSVSTLGGASVELSGPMAPGGDVADEVWSEAQYTLSPDGQRVVYLADQGTDEVYELFSVPIDGSAAPVRLHAPLSGSRDVEANGFQVTADGAHVVFGGDLLTDDVIELFSAPIDGSQPPVRLNPPLVPGGGLHRLSASSGLYGSLVLAPGGRHVFYLAEQDTDGVVELYSVAVDGSAPTVKRNGALVAGGDVARFSIGASAASVLYLADQDVDERFELFRGTLPPNTPPKSGPGRTPAAGGTRTVP